MRLIPAIDLKGGRCVRLLRGDFDAETRYAADPNDLADRYRACGADWLHVVDLDGARDGGGANRALVAALARRHGLHVQMGGGLRDLAAVTQVLDLGVRRAVVGSLAITDPAAVKQWFREFGAERLTLAFDVRLDVAGMPRVAIHGWRDQSELSLWDAVAGFADSGVRHVLCTDVSRDGALAGPNVALYAEAHRRYPGIEWQASGGVRDANDLHALATVGAAAAISGKALLDNLIPPEEWRPFLPNASFPA